MPSPLPPREAVAQLLGMLLDRTVRVAPAKQRLDVERAERVAHYIEDGGNTVFAALADRAFLATVGGALALVPAAVVNEAIRDKVLPINLFENAYEVLNISASLFNQIEDAKAHVRLRGLDLLRDLPPELRPRVGKPANRLDCEVSIQSYGLCHLTLLHL